MKRWGFIVAVLGALVTSLLFSRTGLWAAPDVDPLRQTVPTMTPTSQPGSPTPRPATPTPTPEGEERETPTPTREGPERETPEPPEPTATQTWTPQPAATLTPTPEPSPELTQPPVVSPLGTPVSLAGVPAWDFGDAPDPPLPSLLASGGARHAIVEYEWLGEEVDQEEDSQQVDDDLCDDGVEIGELITCAQAHLAVTLSVHDREDPQHPYDADHLLYLNVLVDWDADGSWDGTLSCPEGLVASEWAVQNLPVDPSSWAQGTNSAMLSVPLPVGPRDGQVWSRFTLSYGEMIAADDWDGRGAFTFGETEDYLLIISTPPATTTQVGSPGAVAAATETPTPAPPTASPTQAGWWQSLLCFGMGLLFGLVVVAIWVARKRGDWRLFIGGLVLITLLLMGGFLYHGLHFAPLAPAAEGRSPTIAPTPHERLIPTPTAHGEPTMERPHPTLEPVIDSTPELNIAPRSESQRFSPTPLHSLSSAGQRLGFGEAGAPIERFAVEQLHAGWYYAWRADANPPRPHGLEFVQTVQVRGTTFSPQGDALQRVIQNNPGALWLVGNEPDVIWQDNATPTEYARVYHEVYNSLKGMDPTCQVAIAGVSQATPMRLQYLDMILQAYQDLCGETIPVDVWNVHGYILREERGAWGVDIPPGISADQGRLYEISDHDDMEIFRDQILTFRRWMSDKGERDKPLIVSEFGVLMPADYGFAYERVRDFMYASFDYLLTASDASLGYPADSDRLVQRWAWYSLSDTVYPTGNLFDPDTGQITPLGLAYGSYVSSH